MNTKQIIYILTGIGLSVASVNGQTVSEIVMQNDTVIHKLSECQGDIQWQQSEDLGSWLDRDGQTSDSLIFLADTTTYVRAKVTAGMCDPFYSDTSYIEVKNWPKIFVRAGGNHWGRLYMNGEFTLFDQNLYTIGKAGSNLIVSTTGYALVIVDTNGAEIKTIEYPEGIYCSDFVPLDTSYVLLNNMTDSAYFIDSYGHLYHTFGFPNTAPDHLQYTGGVIVNDTLVISNNGNDQIIGYDLINGGDPFIYRDFTGMDPGHMSSIKYYKDKFYVGSGSKLQTFTRTGELETFCTIPEYNITGLILFDDIALLTVNFADRIYRVDLQTGEYSVLFNDIDYPEDIEFIE